MSSPKIITIDGSIAVGKSTLCKNIERLRSPTHVSEEPVNAGLLALFYSDPKRYAFAFQLAMVLARLNQADRLNDRREKMAGIPETWLLWDRSLIGDRCFACENVRLGNISHAEEVVYSSFNKGVEADLYVLLEDEPAACLERSKQRARTSEAGVTLEYLEGLDDWHFDLFVLDLAGSQRRPLLVLPYRDFAHDAAVAVTRIEKGLRGEGLGRVTLLWQQSPDIPVPWHEWPVRYESVPALEYGGPRPLPGVPGGNVIFGSAVTSAKRHGGHPLNAFKRTVLAHLARGDSVTLCI